MRTNEYAIIDLDNCISDDHWRLHLINLNMVKPNDRYWAYHDACHLDMHQNQHWVRDLSAKFRIAIFTSRPEIVRGKTEQWLRKWGIHHDFLFMRPDHDHSPSVPLKREMLSWLPADAKPVYAIDDRTDILDMYANEGVRMCARVFIHTPEMIHP